MKKLLLFLCCLLGIGLSAYATDEAYYTIKFVKGENSNTYFSTTTSVAEFVAEGGEYLSGVASGQSNSFPHTAEGIRVGSKSGAGNVTFNLSDAGKVKATRIIVNAKGNQTYSHLTVNGLPVKTASKTAGTAIANTDYKDYEFKFPAATEISQLVLTGYARIFITSITVYYEAASNAPQQVTVTPAADQNSLITVDKNSNVVFTSKNASHLKVELASESGANYVDGDTYTHKATKAEIIKVTPLDADRNEYSDLSIIVDVQLNPALVPEAVVITPAPVEDIVTVYKGETVTFSSVNAIWLNVSTQINGVSNGFIEESNTYKYVANDNATIMVTPVDADGNEHTNKTVMVNVNVVARPAASAVTFSPAGGDVDKGTKVTMSSDDNAAKIVYTITTDGTTGAAVEVEGKSTEVTLTASCTITAWAVNGDGVETEKKSATYNVVTSEKTYTILADISHGIPAGEYIIGGVSGKITDKNVTVWVMGDQKSNKSSSYREGVKAVASTGLKENKNVTNTATITTDKKYVVTITPTEGGYTIECGAGNYLYSSTAKNVNVKSEPAVWTLAESSTFDDIKFQTDDIKSPTSVIQLMLNGGSERFCTYASPNTSMNTIQLYCINDGADAELSFEKESATVAVGKTFTQTVTNPNNLTISYASSNTDIATVDATTGEVTGVTVGSTTITATGEGTGFKTGKAKYTINVIDVPADPAYSLGADRTSVTFTSEGADQITVVTYQIDGESTTEIINAASTTVNCNSMAARFEVTGKNAAGETNKAEFNLINELNATTSVAAGDWTLVENIADLKEGAEYIILGHSQGIEVSGDPTQYSVAKGDYLLSKTFTSADKKFTTEEVTLPDDRKTISQADAANAAIFKLKKGTDGFAIYATNMQTKSGVAIAPAYVSPKTDDTEANVILTAEPEYATVSACTDIAIANNSQKQEIVPLTGAAYINFSSTVGEFKYLRYNTQNRIFRCYNAKPATMHNRPVYFYTRATEPAQAKANYTVTLLNNELAATEGVHHHSGELTGLKEGDEVTLKVVGFDGKKAILYNATENDLEQFNNASKAPAKADKEKVIMLPSQTYAMKLNGHSMVYNAKPFENVGELEVEAEFTPFVGATVKTNEGVPTGIEDVEAGAEEGEVEYFNLQGVRVMNPTNGIYIRKYGSKVTKVCL